MRFQPGLRFLSVGVVALSLFLVACSDDGSSTGTASGSSTGSATGEPAGAGVVQAKPANAVQVDVTLTEFAIRTSVASARAGELYFLVENAGPDDPHEFVVIRTDLAPTSLPVEDGVVPEDEIDLVDEIEPFSPRTKASLFVNLPAGKYVLICNIAEIEDGELESHYEEGMRTAFTVQ